MLSYNQFLPRRFGAFDLVEVCTFTRARFHHFSCSFMQGFPIIKAAYARFQIVVRGLHRLTSYSVLVLEQLSTKGRSQCPTIKSQFTTIRRAFTTRVGGCLTVRSESK